METELKELKKIVTTKKNSSKRNFNSRYVNENRA